MRNSVKATVDAYDGTVTLYAWDDQDPILKAWSSAFPGTVKPKSDIPEALLGAPPLPRGHVQGAALPVRALPRHRPQRLVPGQQPLGGPRGPERRQEPAAAVPDVRDPAARPGAVRREPRQRARPAVPTGSDVVDDVHVRAVQAAEPRGVTSRSTPTRPRTPTARCASSTSSTSSSRAPARSPTRCARTPRSPRRSREFNRSGNHVTYGNLLTVPVGDELMYVEPVYARLSTASEANFPILRYVLVSYRGGVGIGTTLTEALDRAKANAGDQRRAHRPAQRPADRHPVGHALRPAHRPAGQQHRRRPAGHGRAGVRPRRPGPRGTATSASTRTTTTPRATLVEQAVALENAGSTPASPSGTTPSASATP